MVCVGNDNDVRSVVLGPDGLLAGLKPGSILVDHTTASATLARELSAECAKKSVGFIDAPVSGGQAGAQNGVLTVMCGASSETFNFIQPVAMAFSRAVTLMGDVGAGQTTKMVNQICIAGLVQALSEGLAFAEKAGLDANLVLEVISKGAAQSWQMENRGKTMVADKFDFGFAVGCYASAQLTENGYNSLNFFFIIFINFNFCFFNHRFRININTTFLKILFKSLRNFNVLNWKNMI